MDKTSIVQDWPDEESFHMTFGNSVENPEGVWHQEHWVSAKIAPNGDGPIEISKVAHAYNWFVRNVIWRLK